MLFPCFFQSTVFVSWVVLTSVVFLLGHFAFGFLTLVPAVYVCSGDEFSAEELESVKSQAGERMRAGEPLVVVWKLVASGSQPSLNPTPYSCCRVLKQWFMLLEMSQALSRLC